MRDDVDGGWIPRPPKRPWPLALAVLLLKLVAAVALIAILGPFWVIGIAFCILIPLCWGAYRTRVRISRAGSTYHEREHRPCLSVELSWAVESHAAALEVLRRLPPEHWTQHRHVGS